jgi:enterobacterial common antigen flippase
MTRDSESKTSLTSVTLVRRYGRAGARSGVFAAAVAVPRLAGLLTVPVYARALGPDAFGAFELLVSGIALLYALTSLGLDFAIAVRYHERDDLGRSGDLSAAVATGAVVASTTAIVLALVAAPIAAGLGHPAASMSVALALMAVPCNVVANLLSIFVRLRLDATRYFVALVGGSSVGAITGVIAVVAGYGLAGAVGGVLVAHVATLLLFLLATRGQVSRTGFSRGRTIELVRLGLPLAPAAAATWVFAFADRFFLAAMFGLYEVGLYAAAARLASGLSLLQYGFHAAWGPVALRWGTLADPSARYAASLRFLAVAGGASVAVLSWLATPLLTLLTGPDYAPAANVVWLLGGSVLFNAMFSTVQIGASVAKQGGRIAGPTIIAALVNTALNIVLIPTLGYVGAGVATLAAYATAFGTQAVMSHAVRPFQLELWRSTAWAAGWIVISGASIVVPASSQLPATVTILVIAFATTIWAVRSFLQRLAATADSQPTGAAV